MRSIKPKSRVTTQRKEGGDKVERTDKGLNEVKEMKERRGRK